MKKLFIAAGSISLVFLFWYMFYQSSTEVINYPPKDGPIVAFGDSLVKGVGSLSTQGFVGPLSSRIEENIINLGVAGDTTKDGLVRVAEILDKEPRVVLVLLGGNDFLKRVPKEETFNNLRLLITEIQDTGAIVVLVGVQGGLITDSYEKHYAALAHETGSAYVPNVLDDVFAKPALMSDTVHPNKAGYEIIADKIYRVLQTVAY